MGIKGNPKKVELISSSRTRKRLCGVEEQKEKDIQLRIYREEALRAATELVYSSDIIERIRTATTIGEMERALMAGREQIRSYKHEYEQKRKTS